MTSNPLREISSISHDIRLIGFKKLPRKISRACLIFCNFKAHKNSESPKESLKIAKIAKYLECEVYFITDATVEEFIDAMTHFLIETTEFLFIFMAVTDITKPLINKSELIQLKNDNIEPELIFDLFNSKNTNNKIFFLLDAIYNPINWNLNNYNFKKNNIYLMAPYPESNNKEIIQFDRSMNGIFSLTLSKIIKSNPESSIEIISKLIENEISNFGQKIYYNTFPNNLIQQNNFLT